MQARKGGKLLTQHNYEEITLSLVWEFGNVQHAYIGESSVHYY